MHSYDLALRTEGSPLRVLTPREIEVLKLASDGSTNHEIGEQLGLTVHAVKFHLASVYRKLSVANRTEAAVVLMTDLANAGGQRKE